MESEELNIALDKVKAVDKAPSIDAEKYMGKKVKIDLIKIKKEIDHYHGGQVYDEESKETCFRVYLYTEPIRELDEAGEFTDKAISVEKEGVKEPLRVYLRFNLGKNAEDENVPEISKHPKAACWKFMRKMGAETLEELKGKYVLLDTKPSSDPEDKRVFLTIAN